MLHIRENAFNGMERLVLCSGTLFRWLGKSVSVLKKLRHQIFLKEIFIVSDEENLFGSDDVDCIIDHE